MPNDSNNFERITGKDILESGGRIDIGTRPPETFEEAMAQISRKCDDLMIAKQRDYGRGNIDKFGTYGVLVRLSDKLERLINLYNSGKEPSNEALYDTWQDIRNYGQIAIALEDDLWGLPLEEDRFGQIEDDLDEPYYVPREH